MAKGYTKEFRKRAIAIVDNGESAREAARLLKIGAATAIRWVDTTTSPSAMFVFGIFGLVAESSVTCASGTPTTSLRKRERVGGRPKSLGLEAIKKAKALLASGQYTSADVSTSRHTLWRALALEDAA